MGLEQLAGAASNVLGAVASIYLNKRAADRNENLQRDFANNGIAMRVADAKRSGIHPVFALGASLPSGSPVALGDTSISESFGRAGQDITRALISTATQEQRDAVLFDQQVERNKLENELLKLKVHQSSQIGPAMPSNSGMPLLTGQAIGKTGEPYVVENSLQRVHSQPDNPAQEVGAIADYAFARTPTGLVVIPGTDIKNRIEDQMIPEIHWAIRNQLMPALSGLPEPDPKYYTPPKGYNAWEWKPQYQEFRPVHRKSHGVTGNF